MFNTTHRWHREARPSRFVFGGHEREQAPEVVNPAWMSARVKIKRIGRGFMCHGRAVELREVVTMEAYAAQGLVAMGRAERIED
ncbi:MAG: hypothetical protein GDA67_01815 [Nitrospira sp. CR1.3]|nr:hypothetical protein [Nitrospira sp. CR1.3]